MNILIAVAAFAAAQTAPAAPVDHSQHNPAQRVEEQQGQHQPAQQQDHANMMKHCHDKMAKMHKSMHEKHGNRADNPSDQRNSRLGK